MTETETAKKTAADFSYGPEKVEDLVRLWDEGECFQTVEMGGLGPGYEQALQILVIEILREMLEVEFPKVEGKMDDSVRDELRALRDRVVHRIDEQCGGYSGAQVGAATSLAWHFYNKGYRETLAEVTNECGEDRLMLVSKDFPQAPTPKETP